MFRKKGIISGVLLLFILLSIAGCQTAKGIAQGVGYTVEGAAKDTQSLGAAIMSLDGWIRENLW